jgi:asparagine synthase (glutamine-hydrolysing)
VPGLFGVIDLSPVRRDGHEQELLSIASRMARAMRFEPFHGAAVVSVPALQACVGSVNLFEEDVRDRQLPEDGLLVVTTGDVVPSEDREPSGLRAVVERGPGASAIAKAYRAGSADVLASLPGLRAGVIVDPARRQCVLFNDRYGVERLYLHVDGDRVFFASGAKAILAVAPKTRAFDGNGLAELFACGCTLGSHSIFHDIEVLQPGTAITCASSTMTRRRYAGPETPVSQDAPSAAEFVEGFSESLRRAVDSCVRTSSRLAVSVTGGLDSRMVIARLDAPPGTVPCYTFGSMYRTTGDVAIGKRVAESCGQPYQVLELGTGFLKNARTHLEQAIYASDGYLGLPAAAELYVNRLARAVAPARMTGNWGGELMRGVRAFKYRTPKGGFLSADLLGRMQASASAFVDTPGDSVSTALYQQIPCQGFARYAVERSQLIMRTPFLADDVVGWLLRAPAAVRGTEETAAAVIGRRPDLLSIPTDLGRLGPPPRAIRRAVRKALIKAEYLTSHGASDLMARVATFLPDPLLETRFLGVDKFYHFRRWTRHELAEMVRDVLVREDTTVLERWFDMRRVSQMVDDHIAGQANHIDALDKLMTVAVAGKTLLREVH